MIRKMEKDTKTKRVKIIYTMISVLKEQKQRVNSHEQKANVENHWRKWVDWQSFWTWKESQEKTNTKINRGCWSWNKLKKCFSIECQTQKNIITKVVFFFICNNEKEWKNKKINVIDYYPFSERITIFCENNDKFNLKKILPCNKW